MINNKPDVSVIIPIYNRFDLLMRTLKSLKLQTFRNFEVIIIDDCSQEKLNLFAIKELLNDIKVVYKPLKVNSGPGKARSVGRKLARGKYVTYLDSDDEWRKDFLISTVSILNEYKEVSMVFSNTLIKFKNGTRERNKMSRGVKNFFTLIIEKKTYWATGAALWRSEISLSQNWSCYRDHEDYYHDITCLYDKPKIYYLPEKLCVINKNEASGIKRSNIEMFKVLIEILKNFLRHKKDFKVDLVNFVTSRLRKRKYNLKESYYFFLIGNLFFKKGYYKSYIKLYKIYFERLSL